MSALEQPEIDIEAIQCDDQCIGSHLGTALDDNTEPSVVIVGYPSEEGARRLGAPLGASKGPDMLRGELYRMKPHPKHYSIFSTLLAHTKDLGNIAISGDMESDQEALAKTIAPFLKKEILVIILGGNHETSYGHFLGYVEAGKETSIFNFDAHPDVDPIRNNTYTAGTTFRQVLEHPSGKCNTYTVAGLQPSETVKAHLEYLRSKKARYFLKDAVNLSTFKYILDETSTIPMMFSLDLDVMDQISAPGVSWPTVDGVDIDTVLKTAYRTAQHPLVTSLDLVELNPTRDINNRTSKLAALILWNFLKGLSLRLKL